MALLSIFLTAAMVSCGPKLNKRNENLSVTVSKALSYCSNDSDETFEQFEAFVQNHSKGMGWINRFSLKVENKPRPSIISRELLKAKALSLMSGQLRNSNTNNIQKAILLRNQLQDLSLTYNNYQRLKFLECHMEDYWEKGKIPFGSYIDALSENTSVEIATNLCSAFKGSARCYTEAVMSKRQNKLEIMQKLYLDRFEHAYVKPRFKLVNSYKNVTCRKQDGETILDIPVADQLEFTQLWDVAKNWWQSDEAKVRLNFVKSDSSDAIAINLKSSGPSFVDFDKPEVINLGPGQTIPIILAHELGHSLGFPDCYFEGWDKAKKGFVYYELDEFSDNLMCGIHADAKVPTDYFLQLQKHYCQN